MSSVGSSPRSNHSPTYGLTCSETNRRTVSRIARSSSERRASSARKSRGSRSVLREVVATAPNRTVSCVFQSDKVSLTDRSIKRVEVPMVAFEERTAAGVSFSLTEEQKELRRLARDFAAKEIRPLEHECDEAMRHPAEVIEKAHELGLMNLHVPEEYGGPGLSSFDGMLVGEELNWGCSGIATSIGANGLGSGPVISFGTDEQKRKWLTPLLDEPILACFGLSEPGAGSDVASLKTTAVREGDEYVIN